MEKEELEIKKYFYSMDGMEILNFVDHINEMLKKHTEFEFEFGEGGDSYEDVILVKNKK